MKLGLAIASEKALPSAFVVFRDKLSNSIRKVAQLGYDGVDLALLDSFKRGTGCWVVEKSER